MARLPRLLLFCCLLALPKPLLWAQGAARFDLTGPKIEVRVSREGKTLPIAAVPNLQAGDQLWLHPDLPPTQSVHYLLVAAFLRGTTNPPPEKWFTRIETWDKHVRAEGVTLTVPPEAQQAILFLAPETGGDFSSLRSAVRGRPGIFVRASQDLAEAGFEQARIEKYLASMRLVPPSDPKALLEHSNLLARALNLKPNDDCFKRPVDQQYNCLTQTGTQSLLEDGHGQTVVATLTSGASSDFINAASATQLAGGGTYSAYVGAIVDLVRIMGGLHTAHYQYIPAIAFPDAASLNLRLNTPPSFQNPKSVIVIGLPAIQRSSPPPLRASDLKAVACLLKPDVALSVEGAPLVFSTAFAHDLTLHFEGKNAPADLPLTPDAFQGGLALTKRDDGRRALPEPGSSNTSRASISGAGEKQTSSDGPVSAATVRGFWGFDAFTGPTLPVQIAPGGDWHFADSTRQVILGEKNEIVLASSGAACVQAITFADESGASHGAEWKPGSEPNTVDVSLTPRAADPGALNLAVQQFGGGAPARVAVQTFSKPATLAGLELHAGDTTARLTGTSLREIRELTVGDLTFHPARAANPIQGASKDGRSSESLTLALPKDAAGNGLRPEQQTVAQVKLADGRMLPLSFTVAPPRPSVEIIAKRFEPTVPSPIQLGSPDDIPLDSRLSLSVRSPGSFPRDGQIEIQGEDGSIHARLTVADGSLTLQNSRTVLGSIDLRKSFGASAFGPLSLRVVVNGTPGAWLPLGTLVRLPALKELHCGGDGPTPCTLAGTDLFLLSSVATEMNSTQPITVPEGFVGSSVAVPQADNNTFYLKLRDDPSPTNTVTLPATP